MSHAPLVLFDVDGTLLLTGGAGMRAMERTAATLYGAGFRWDGIVFSGHLDPLLFAEAAGRSGLEVGPDDHRAFRDGYLEALRHELLANAAKVRAMPGVHAAIAELRTGGGAVVGLLTGNYSAAVPLKLRAIDLDPAWFEVTAFGDEGESRSALVRLALAKYSRLLGAPRVDPRRVMIVGDTPRDVECAHDNGCVVFGVATGRYSVEELREAGADFVVADLGDPRPLLAAVSALSSR